MQHDAIILQKILRSLGSDAMKLTVPGIERSGRTGKIEAVLDRLIFCENDHKDKIKTLCHYQQRGQKFISLHSVYATIKIKINITAKTLTKTTCGLTNLFHND